MLEASSLTSSLTLPSSDRSKIMEAAAKGSNKAETDNAIFLIFIQLKLHDTKPDNTINILKYLHNQKPTRHCEVHGYVFVENRYPGTHKVFFHKPKIVIQFEAFLILKETVITCTRGKWRGQIVGCM